MSMGLTQRQLELLAYINSYIAEHGIARTTGEMRDKLNLSSKSGVVRLLNGLEERRLIRRIHRRARAIEVVKPGLDGFPARLAALSDEAFSMVVDVVAAEVAKRQAVAA